MLERDRSPMPRRGFLSGLASLPLIGGGVSLIGQPTAAAVPVTDELRWSYKEWLFMEHRMLSFELAGHDRQRGKEMERCFVGSIANGWHLQWARPGDMMAGWDHAPQPSSRAAVILSAAGVPLSRQEG